MNEYLTRQLCDSGQQCILWWHKFIEVDQKVVISWQIIGICGYSPIEFTTDYTKRIDITFMIIPKNQGQYVVKILFQFFEQRFVKNKNFRNFCFALNLKFLEKLTSKLGFDLLLKHCLGLGSDLKEKVQESFE